MLYQNKYDCPTKSNIDFFKMSNPGKRKPSKYLLLLIWLNKTNVFQCVLTGELWLWLEKTPDKCGQRAEIERHDVSL